MKRFLQTILIFICLLIFLMPSASALSILALPPLCFTPIQITVATGYTSYRDIFIRYIIANSNMKDNDSARIDEVISGLEMIPIRYLSAFIEEGWHIDIVNFDKYYPEYQWAAGICDYNDKRICMNNNFNKNNVIHEIGHFVDYYTNTRDLYSETLYQEYLDSPELQKLMREYSGTSRHEYMADIFKYWIIEGESFQEQLKILAPNTYQVIHDVMNGAILNENYDFTIIPVLFAA